MKTFSIASLVALATFATGCFGATEPNATGEPQANEATAGLEIAERRSDLVRGVFRRGAHTLSFEFEVAGGVHTSRIADEAGPIMTSTLTGSFEETVYLDGRAKVSGDLADEKPAIEGDPKIFEALDARPAASLIGPLKAALRAAKVDRSLYSAWSDGGGSGVKPKWTYDGSRYGISYNESFTFSTPWQAWMTTLFVVLPETAFTAVKVQALTGWSPPEYSGVIGANPWYSAHQYYGYSVRVTDVLAPLCATCNTRALIQVYYY